MVKNDAAKTFIGSIIFLAMILTIAILFFLAIVAFRWAFFAW